MAASRPSSRNLAAKPASQPQSDLTRNGEIQNSGERQKKRSTSSRQSQHHDLLSHESQSHRSLSQKSQSQDSQRHELSCQKNIGGVEVLTFEGQSSFQELLKPNDRPTSGNRAKKAPSINRINSAPRRTPTPTKQIILEAAKRKQEPMLTFKENHETNARIRKDQATKEEKKDPGQRSPKAVFRRKEDEKKDKDDDDDDDDDEEEESSSDEELIKAPNELMMEFLDCVLKGDYANGHKLCTMILLYEPENAEALSFKSLIEEKMAVDVSNDDDSDDDEDEEEEDDEDSSDEESDSSDTSDDKEEDDEEEEEEEAKTKEKSKEKTIFLP